MDIRLDHTAMKTAYDRGIINFGNIARMKRVMDKALSGKGITVGFIGGSITAGSLSSTPKKCYAYLVTSWWRDKFPEAIVSYINAGVGATTSQFGAARVDQDLLCHGPDVIFAEFSVNDGNAEFFKETFEGLIRKILLYKTEPALFMFNNVFYDDGRNSQEIHNQVGRYYDLPIVSMKESIYAEIEKGTILRERMTPDNLHPNDLGHELVAAVILNLLEEIYDAARKGSKDIDMVSSRPLTKNRYALATAWNNKNTNPTLHGFKKDMTVKAGCWDVFRDGWYAGHAGDSINLSVQGAFLSVQYRKYVKHPAPEAKIVIDHEESNAVILDAGFDETWGDCLYLKDIMVDVKPGMHTIEISAAKAVEGQDFYLAAIITA